MDERYRVADAAAIATPALLFYEDIIRQNIRSAVELAGGPQRLRPHIKTHKTREICLLEMELGIRKFKCATIAEAELLGMVEAEEAMLAYPLVGPNVARFLRLVAAYPKTRFQAVADDEGRVRALSEAARAEGRRVETLIDVDPGFHRTGAEAKAARELYARLASMEGLFPGGLHCYDGHNTQKDPAERADASRRCYGMVMGLKQELIADGLPVPRVVLCGTPTFPAYARMPDVELSPGTSVLHDGAYSTQFPDLPFVPAALILTRVVSRHPERGTFTLDLGCKGLGSDPPGQRGVLFDRPERFAQPLFQSEEHWVFHREEGALPEIGEVMYVLPTHICPSVALYGEAHIISAGGRLRGTWEIAARARRISI